MPQMAPLMWLTLFILFSITLELSSILNFWSFFFQPTFNNTKHLETTSSLTLTWKL